MQISKWQYGLGCKYEHTCMNNYKEDPLTKTSISELMGMLLQGVYSVFKSIKS